MPIPVVKRANNLTEVFDPLGQEKPAGLGRQEVCEASGIRRKLEPCVRPAMLIRT